ncbi:hypothetical protein EYF80_030457 [Liparis tanakae]|uniref:Uncharacterized protein n=1 Tax=Liparis tanakae TaxID=230148 RepID=A0A4Z2H3F9_9TELE|nr:hypothetical protein EYF80_030457 [Liparis tanakae]
MDGAPCHDVTPPSLFLSPSPRLLRAAFAYCRNIHNFAEIVPFSMYRKLSCQVMKMRGDVMEEAESVTATAAPPVSSGTRIRYLFRGYPDSSASTSPVHVMAPLLCARDVLCRHKNRRVLTWKQQSPVGWCVTIPESSFAPPHPGGGGGDT